LTIPKRDSSSRKTICSTRISCETLTFIWKFRFQGW
jgi:hypothetical protein